MPQSLKSVMTGHLAAAIARWRSRGALPLAPPLTAPRPRSDAARRAAAERRARRNSPTCPFTHGKAADGATKSAVCSACHGPNGNSVNPEWPRLAGQSAVYIAEQLRLFRSGVRDNPVMKPLAATLSDQDISDLAVYYEAQTPDGARGRSVVLAGRSGALSAR